MLPPWLSIVVARAPRCAALALVSGAIACGAAPLPPAPEPRRAAPSCTEAPFYVKEARDGTIPIRASAEATDEALAAARERLARMLARAPRIRRNLERAGFEVRVTARGQRVSDLPEFRSRRRTPAGGDGTHDFDERTRGGGHQELRKVVCATETLLGGAGDPQPGHDLCVHELAHGIDSAGLSPDVRAQILARQRAAVASGLWNGAYAATNYGEFFAELSMWYFGGEGGSSPHVPHGRGPGWLRAYDPESFELLDGIYTDRIKPGDASRNPLAPTERADLPTRAADRPVIVEFLNATALTLRVAWIDFDAPRPAFELPPGVAREAYTFTTHAWTATDDVGRSYGTYVAGGTDSVVVLQMAAEPTAAPPGRRP